MVKDQKDSSLSHEESPQNSVKRDSERKAKQPAAEVANAPLRARGDSRVVYETATQIGEYVTAVNFCSLTHAASLLAVVTSRRLNVSEYLVGEYEDEDGDIVKEYAVVQRRSIQKSAYGGKSFVDLAWDFETSNVELTHGTGDAAGTTPAVMFVADGNQLVCISCDLEDTEKPEDVEVISDHSGWKIVALTSKSTSRNTLLATVAVDNILRLWTVEPGTRGKESHLDAQIDLGSPPRSVHLRANVRNIVMVTGTDGLVRFLDLKGDYCIEEVDMAMREENSVKVNAAAWHPNSPSTYALATNLGVLFSGADKRSIGFPSADVKWCPSTPRYLAVMRADRMQVVVYNGNEAIKNLTALGVFSSITWHAFLPVLVCGVGHALHVYKFAS